MHYVVSGIHGLYDRYLDLLGHVGFGAEDQLFVLGDVLGYGPQGLRTLHDIVTRDNAVCLLGDQEFSALVCLPWLLEELLQEGTRDEVLAARMQQMLSWKASGGEAVMEEFSRLSLPAQQIVLDELAALPLYREVEAGGQRFILVHAGLEHFAPDRPLADYQIDELVATVPDVTGRYFEDRYLVFGHTPTPLLCPPDEAAIHPPRIFRRGTLIGVDCGCRFGGPLGCLCLETLEGSYA